MSMERYGCCWTMEVHGRPTGPIEAVWDAIEALGAYRGLLEAYREAMVSKARTPSLQLS